MPNKPSPTSPAQAGNDTPAAADQPLGLTVHTMPNSAEVMAAPAGNVARGRWKMLLVMLVCAAPVIASYFTYYVIRPDGRRNFGDLIEPQRTLPDVTARALDGQPTNLRTLKGQWLLVSVGPSNCDKTCAHNLYLQRQVHTSLGKEKDRVERVWLVVDDNPAGEQPIDPTLRAAITDAAVLRLGSTEVSAWLAAAPGKNLADHLYLVDPIGNWMMRFPAELDLQAAAKAKRDIERLLRASSSWDKAGR